MWEALETVSSVETIRFDNALAWEAFTPNGKEVQRLFGSSEPLKILLANPAWYRARKCMNMREDDWKCKLMQDALHFSVKD